MNARARASVVRAMYASPLHVDSACHLQEPSQASQGFGFRVSGFGFRVSGREVQGLEVEGFRHRCMAPLRVKQGSKPNQRTPAITTQTNTTHTHTRHVFPPRDITAQTPVLELAACNLEPKTPSPKPKTSCLASRPGAPSSP